MMDDITQQGFSRRYYHGAGISMEPLGPSSVHRFGLLPDPNLLKGASDWANRAMVRALGINFAQALVLHHPYSSLAAINLLPTPLFYFSFLAITVFCINCQILMPSKTVNSSNYWNLLQKRFTPYGFIAQLIEWPVPVNVPLTFFQLYYNLMETGSHHYIVSVMTKIYFMTASVISVHG